MDLPHKRSSNPAHKVQRLSPRVKMALRAYLTGAVRTKKEAAEVFGVTREYLSMVNRSPAGRELEHRVDGKIEDQALDTSKLLSLLSKEAVLTTAAIMRKGDKEENRLRAAIDLADRGPETSKIQKHQVESVTLTGKDVKELAAAMVQAARLKEQFAEATEGNFDKTKFIQPERAEDSSG